MGSIRSIMQNEAGEYVDLYIPRKCSASNRIIAAKDHASIQLNIVDVDEKTGRMTGTSKTYAICGTIRRMGESDDCINRLAKKRWYYSKELLIQQYVNSKGKYNKTFQLKNFLSVFTSLFSSPPPSQSTRFISTLLKKILQKKV